LLLLMLRQQNLDLMYQYRLHLKYLYRRRLNRRYLPLMCRRLDRHPLK
jgi:hypothetical protein